MESGVCGFDFEHEVLPEYREYERWSDDGGECVCDTDDVAVSGRRWKRGLVGRGCVIMQSNGGSISAE